MTKKTKAWSIAALICILAGVILFCSVMFSLEWDFSALSTYKYVTNTHEIDDFQNIFINTNTADIEFVISESENALVVCFEDQSNAHQVTVENGTLKITAADNKKWFEFIGINFYTTKITLYLPKAKYGDIIVKGNTGDILASDLSAFKLDFTISTGDIFLKNITCEQEIMTMVSTGNVNIADSKGNAISSGGSTGDVIFENVIADEYLIIARSTGNVKLNSCDSAMVYVETDTGDIKGKFLTEKQFIANTDTGYVSVPNSTSGGKCELTTNTGDIIFN